MTWTGCSIIKRVDPNAGERHVCTVPRLDREFRSEFGVGTLSRCNCGLVWILSASGSGRHGIQWLLKEVPQ